MQLNSYTSKELKLSFFRESFRNSTVNQALHT